MAITKRDAGNESIKTNGAADEAELLLSTSYTTKELANISSRSKILIELIQALSSLPKC